MFKRLWLKLGVITYHTVFSIFALILTIPYYVLKLIGKLPKDTEDLPMRHIN